MSLVELSKTIPKIYLSHNSSCKRGGKCDYIPEIDKLGCKCADGWKPTDDTYKECEPDCSEQNK